MILSDEMLAEQTKAIDAQLDKLSAGIDRLKEENAALVKVRDAAQNLADHVKRSLDAGPITNRPGKEAHYWRELRSALSKATGAQ